VADPAAPRNDSNEPLTRWNLIARTSDSANSGLPALFTPTPSATERFLEFFTAQINNDHTRRAYANATRRFATWCAAHGIRELNDVRPIHVATFIKELEGTLSPPSVKQNLAALRMLFDWLVTGHVLDTNPAHAVRGPKYVVHKGKTPVLNADEARTLIDSIDTSGFVGLRDRALIGIMIYTFARIGAVLEMKVKDYFVQSRRGWVRLHEKGGKEHEVPCHHHLETYLDAYIAAAGIADDGETPLFRTTGRKLRQWTPMTQQDAFRMIQRRAKAAGLETRVNNHTFRATGITAYMKNGGTLEHAQQLANHSSPRTTKLYDRRQDEISLDEVEKIVI
jgi:site-specific recombinase XerD